MVYGSFQIWFVLTVKLSAQWWVMNRT